MSEGGLEPSSSGSSPSDFIVYKVEPPVFVLCPQHRPTIVEAKAFSDRQDEAGVRACASETV